MYDERSGYNKNFEYVRINGDKLPGHLRAAVKRCMIH